MSQFDCVFADEDGNKCDGIENKVQDEDSQVAHEGYQVPLYPLLNGLLWEEGTHGLVVMVDEAADGEVHGQLYAQQWAGILVFN